MRKYIFALILSCGVVLYGQAVYAEVDYGISDNTSTKQMVDKNILADEELMKNISAEQLKSYISQGADVNIKFIRKTKDEQDESKIIETKDVTPLMMAGLGNPDVKVIELLLGNGADIKAQNENGKTAFMYAAQGNPNPEAIETLLKHGADVNAKEEDGWTPLILATRFNENPEVIEALLKHGADVNAYTRAPFITAALFSLGNPNHKIFEMIIQGEIDKFCKINRTYSDGIYYCKDRLNNYMQKEHLLPSCVNDIQAMLALSPLLQALQYTDAGKGSYAYVVLAEMTSKFNCSLSITFKDLEIIPKDGWKE